MDDIHISDDDLNGYIRRFENGHVGMTPLHPNCRPFLAFDAAGRLSFSPQAKERAALQYLWQQIGKDRDYISLARMSRDTGFSYDDCDRMVAQAHVDRKIPRLIIVEEVEG